MSKRVLFLIENLSFLQDRRVAQEALAVQSLGWQVFVVAPGNKDQKKEENINGISVFRYPAKIFPSGFWGYFQEYTYALYQTFFLALKIYFRPGGFSVIHAANPPDLFFLIGAFFKIFGVRFIYDQHDLAPEMFLAKFNTSRTHLLYWATRFAERLSYLLATTHIATCQVGLDFFLKSRNLKNKKSQIVRTAPDLSLLNSFGANPKLLNRLTAIKKDFPYLGVYLGVMGHQDGLSKLLRSIEIFVKKSKRKDIGFLLLGSGDALNDLRITVGKMGLENRVFFLGWMEPKETAACLEVADFGLMPEPKNDYTDYSLHNKVLEYLAFGLPFVSYDLKEVQNNGHAAALYAKNNNEEEYAELINQMLNNLDSQKKEGQKRKAEIMTDQSLSWDNSIKTLKEIYLKLDK